MLSIIARFFLVLIVAGSVACASQSSSTGGSGDTKASGNDYAGTYSNGDGGTLTISNVVAGKSFDFKLVMTGPEACASVDYKGTANFGEGATAKSEGGDSFTMGQGSIKAEPSTEMIGMDCARAISVDFKKQ